MQGLILDFVGDESFGLFLTPTRTDIERIRALMESGNNRSLDAVDKAIKFYQTCTDTIAIKTDTLSHLRQWLIDLGKLCRWRLE